MKAQIDRIPGPWAGRLGIAARPRGGDWLEGEVRSLRDAGVEVIVSLFTPEEVLEFDLQQEQEIAQRYGMRFCSFPIPDRGIPSFRETMGSLVEHVGKSLEAGENVVVPCRRRVSDCLEDPLARNPRGADGYGIRPQIERRSRMDRA